MFKGSADDSEPMVGRIGGIVSTQTTDQQGEQLVQDGVDWTYALRKGWFNYEHKAGPENVLGHPENIEQIMFKGEPATRIEGVLYLHKPKAKEIFETAIAMQKSGTGRRLGFSVEGQVLAREKTRIIKSKVLNVAITAHPVNALARLDVLKSLAAGAVGYQTPAQMGSGSLSALVPQSIAGIQAMSTYAGGKIRTQPKISLAELAKMLMGSFAGVTYPQAMKIAYKMAQSMRG